jgi:transposase-like protein
MKTCPRCKSSSRYRIKRRGLLKYIPGTEAFICQVCDIKYGVFALFNISFRILTKKTTQT